MSAVLQTPPTTRALSGQHHAHEHALLLLLIFLHLCCAQLASWTILGQFKSILHWFDYLSSLGIGLLLTLCIYALYVMAFKRPSRLLRHFRMELGNYLQSQRILFALPVLLAMPVFVASFTALKAAIPHLQPFNWDARLAMLDQSLHGGVAPWTLLQPLLGQPWITEFINICYHLWIVFLWASIFWLAFSSERRRLRMQFLLSMVLTWFLLGNVLALLLSSAGPCYFAQVTDAPNPYIGLFDYLRSANEQVPISALRVQEMLWANYTTQAGMDVLSISAMPSMHVASAVLLALMGWRVHRRLGLALTLFALVIFAGSVHLGWHYAVDGYIGAIGAALIWFAVGRCPLLPGAGGTHGL